MRILIVLCMCLLPAFASAQENPVRLYAPAALVETGMFKYILPRFSLKTQVRVSLVADIAEADIVLGPEGRALFQGGGTTWYLTMLASDNARATRFADWLWSDVGQRTLFGYAPDGTPLFEAPAEVEVAAAAIEITGDADLGHDVSQSSCARCHAVDEAGRKNDIGSSPSFFLLRGMDNWVQRFETFYVLRPHGAFTQIEGVTEPFPPNRPSPIVPITLTLEEVEAVMAYVQSLPAADLGAPIAHQ